MPKGSKYYTTSKAAAATGTPLADITDANITDPNKRQKLDGDSDFALDPKLQAAADGCVFLADALDAAIHGPDPELTHGLPPAAAADGAYDNLLDDERDAADEKEHEEALADLEAYDVRHAARVKNATDEADEAVEAVEATKNSERKTCLLDLNGNQVRMTKLSPAFYLTMHTQGGVTACVPAWMFRTGVDMNPHDMKFKCILDGYVVLAAKINKEMLASLLVQTQDAKKLKCFKLAPLVNGVKLRKYMYKVMDDPAYQEATNTADTDFVRDVIQMNMFRKDREDRIIEKSTTNDATLVALEADRAKCINVASPLQDGSPSNAIDCDAIDCDANITNLLVALHF
jgi:hypothetical protein